MRPTAGTVHDAHFIESDDASRGCPVQEHLHIARPNEVFITHEARARPDAIASPADVHGERDLLTQQEAALAPENAHDPALDGLGGWGLELGVRLNEFDLHMKSRPEACR